MARIDHTAAPNAEMRQQVVYGVDPHGFAMFSSLTAAINGGLAGARAVVAGPSWAGWTQTPQRFRGAGNLGNARPVKKAASEIGDAVSARMADPIMSAFLSREQQ